MSDKLNEVYERYKHLDSLLTDPEWAGDNAPYRMAQDMWAAIQQCQQAKQETAKEIFEELESKGKTWNLYANKSQYQVITIEMMLSDWQALKAKWGVV